MMYDDDFVLSLPNDLSESVVKVLSPLIGKGDRTSDDVLAARDLVSAIMLSHGELLDQQI